MNVIEAESMSHDTIDESRLQRVAAAAVADDARAAGLRSFNLNGQQLRDSRLVAGSQSNPQDVEQALFRDIDGVAAEVGKPARDNELGKTRRNMLIRGCGVARLRIRSAGHVRSAFRFGTLLAHHAGNSFRTMGPTLPSPIVRPSTSPIHVISFRDPVEKTSSAS